MKKKILFYISLFLLFSSCDSYFLIAQEHNFEPEATPAISGTPSDFSQAIYETADLSKLCLEEDCLPEYDEFSTDFQDVYQPEFPEICGFDFDPNQTSQFLLHQDSEGLNVLDLLMSKEDLFFMAWAAVRYQINPHFLLGVMSQESYGNCAAVSVADAEGCFQITNDYGRGQLEESYEARLKEWFWNENPSGYYSALIFIDPTDWFGQTPKTDQYRMTIDPQSSTILGHEVSSVVNFNFGVIASSLYYNWQQYYLYYQKSSLQGKVQDIMNHQDEAKAAMMAAGYNGGMSRLSQSIQAYGTNYLKGMAHETQDYAESVLSYCEGFQTGSSYYTATYNQDEIDYIIDLLSYTYDTSLGIDWAGLKQDIRTNFFATQDEITLVDDVKALIYYISTYDVLLAPEWPALN